MSGFIFRARSTVGDRQFIVAIDNIEVARKKLREIVGDDELEWQPLPDQVLQFLEIKKNEIRQWGFL